MKNCFFILITFFIVACSSTPNNPNTFAKLQNEPVVDGSNRHSFIFKEVDGNKLKIGALTIPNKAAHFITPGSHTLEIYVSLQNDTTSLVWGSTFKVVAKLEAGETYRIKAFEEGWCINMKVLNSQGVVVAGPVVRSLYPFASYNDMQNVATMEHIKEKIKSASCIKS